MQWLVVLVSECIRHFQRKKVSEQRFNASVYQVPGSVRPGPINDVLEPDPVDLWPGHSIATHESIDSL